MCFFLGELILSKDDIYFSARLFISQCFSKGSGDRLQIFLTDFIDLDFVDACVGLTHARLEGIASRNCSLSQIVVLNFYFYLFLFLSDGVYI